MKTTTLKNLVRSTSGVVCFTCLLSGSASAQLAGDLDTDFGVTGIVSTDFEVSVSEIIQNTMVLSTGKIAVVGYTFASNQDILVGRFNADGTPDNTFGNNGKVLIDASLGANDEGFGIAETNDGHLLISGITVGQSSWDAFVISLNDDGGMDNTFGTGGSGKTLFNGGSNTIAFANEIVVNADNSFYIGASVQTAADGTDFAVFKFNQDGTLNTSFGSNGVFLYDYNSEDQQLNAMSVNTNGNILLAGNTNDGSVSRGLLIRTSPFGTVDSGFGTNGKFVYDASAGDHYFNDAIETSYGKVVVVGSQGTGNDFDGIILQLNTDGTYDNTFSGDGIQSSDIGGSNGIYLWKVMELNGNILTTGQASGLSMKDIYAYMLNPTGGSVSEFSNGDVYITPPVTLNTLNMRCAALQADGKVIIAGDVTGQDFVGNNLYAVRVWTSDADAGLSQAENNQFTVYPNPAQESFSIQSDVPVERLSLMDLQGRTVQNWPASDVYSIPNHVGNGVYVLQVQTANGISSQKIRVNR